MILTFSEPRFSALVRQLEGISDTDDEILTRLDRFAARLFRHVFETYKLRMESLVEQAGTVAAFRFSLHTSDRVAIYQGLQFLNPVSLTLEEADLPKLILNAPMLGAMRQAWPEVESQFERITPDQLMPLIESVTMKVAFAPLPTPTDETEAAVQEYGFQQWLELNGLRDPLAQQNEVDAYRRAEETTYAKSQQAGADSFYANRI